MQVIMQAITVSGVTLHVRSEGPEHAPAPVFANAPGTDPTETTRGLRRDRRRDPSEI